MAEKTGYTYYADPQQVDFTLRMTVPALANEVLNTAGVDAQRKGFGIDKLNKETARGSFRAWRSRSTTAPNNTLLMKS